MSTPSPTVQVPGGQILTEVRDAYRAAYRDRIAEQNIRLTIIRFEPAPDTTTIDPAWATRLHAAQISADQKQRTAEALGAQPDLVVLSDRASAAELAEVIDRTNTDPHVAGIIVQTPPPARLAHLLDAILPAKDIDALGADAHHTVCATADGITRVLAPFLDQHVSVAVIGARGFVGQGVIAQLRAAGHTPLELDLGDDLRLVRDVDIVVSSTGVAGLLTDEHIHRRHRLVIDSGFVPTPGGPVGDLTADAAVLPQNVTPVPGGIGPIEMAVLAERLVRTTAAPELAPWAYRLLPGHDRPLTSVQETLTPNRRRSEPGDPPRPPSTRPRPPGAARPRRRR